MCSNIKCLAGHDLKDCPHCRSYGLKTGTGRGKRRIPEDGTLPLTRQELRHLNAMLGRTAVTKVEVSCGRLLFKMEGYVPYTPLTKYKTVLWLAELFDLENYFEKKT